MNSERGVSNMNIDEGAGQGASKNVFGVKDLASNVLKTHGALVPRQWRIT